MTILGQSSASLGLLVFFFEGGVIRLCRGNRFVLRCSEPRTWHWWSTDTWLSVTAFIKFLESEHPSQDPESYSKKCLAGRENKHINKVFSDLDEVISNPGMYPPGAAAELGKYSQFIDYFTMLANDYKTLAGSKDIVQHKSSYEVYLGSAGAFYMAYLA